MKASLRQRLLIGLTALLLLSETCGFASDLLEAVNALTNNTRPAVYQNQVRGFMTGGGFSVNFPQRRVNFISITPPQLNAGCGGISMFSGGLSYINGDQFVAMLKGIAASSLGEAFAIAVRTLCPVCATVLSDLQKAAQLAAKLAIDQCDAATALVEQGIESVPGLKQYLRSRAAQGSAGNGQQSGFLAAFDKFTDNLQGAIHSRVDALQAITGSTKRQVALNRSPFGNTTWKALAGMTAAQKVFLMSLLGTTVRAPSKNTVTQTGVSPVLTTGELAKLLMFGVDAVMNRNITLLECGQQDSQAVSEVTASQETYPWQCLHPKTVPIRESTWYRANGTKGMHPVGGTGQTAKITDSGGVNLADRGFYGLSAALLFQAVANVAASQPLDTPQTITLPAALYGQHVTVKAHFSLDEIQGFMSLAPLPLYRAVNLAAFYPDIASQLIGNVSELVAGHYAIAWIDQYFLDGKKTGRDDDDGGGSAASEQGIDARLLHALQQAIRRLRIDLHGQLSLLMNQLQTENAWVSQVNQVQATIYQQVLHDGLDANAAYHFAVGGDGA